MCKKNTANYRMGKKKYSRSLIVGGITTDEEIKRILAILNDAGCLVMGVVAPFAKEGYLAIKEGKVDEVVVVMPEGRELFKVLYSFDRYKVSLKVPIDSQSMLSVVDEEKLREKFLFDVRKSNFSVAGTIVKFFFDKLIALSALVVLAPLFLYLAMYIKKNSTDPVIFRQERIGLWGRPFTIYKFRTMVVGAEKNEPQLSTENDSRITPFGAFMRKYRLDELPQFWNVLKGDMSLVGPRPERRYFINQVLERAPYYFLVHNIRPGITSLGMVKYGYAINIDQIIERLQYDIIYYNKMSLWLDVKILFLTVRTVAAGKGI
jgi:exopolysaccharide biosynthesis polyprenyl glycosylphosphotransferase